MLFQMSSIAQLLMGSCFAKYFAFCAHDIDLAKMAKLKAMTLVVMLLANGQPCSCRGNCAKIPRELHISSEGV